tara:strand:+ start:2310 stop:3731 length:1422 start_codon:yes stop_codon:yes gene_type:complete
MYRYAPPAKIIFTYYVLFLVFLAFSFGNTRVAFSRPGSLIRNPSLLAQPQEQEYHIGFSSEIINLNNLNSSDAIYLNSVSSSGLQYGIVYSSHAEVNNQLKTPPSDLSLHFGKRIYETSKMKIDIGINDILYSTPADREHELSFYVSLMHSDIPIGKNKRFNLQTALGFGTGKINYDSHNYTEGIAHKARFFFGMNFKTPYMAKRGGLNCLLDFDGSGIHIGTRVPINKKLDIKVAMTNFQNIQTMNDLQEDDSKTIFSDATAFSFGVGFKFQGSTKTPPKIMSQKVKFSSNPNDCIVVHSRENYENPLAINGLCEDATLHEFVSNINNGFTELHDSIKIAEQASVYFERLNTAKDFEIKMLQDSINMQYLKQRISKSELNIAMKYIAQSLQNYYAGDYLMALEEINQTIKRFPTMAIAYARKGSIYYQMGDLQQATINWNLALKHDPEYAEVREMLSSIKTEIDKISSNNNN